MNDEQFAQVNVLLNKIYERLGWILLWVFIATLGACSAGGY